jgi:hypothetical protein
MRNSWKTLVLDSPGRSTKRDKWKRTEWVMPDGSSLNIGKRFTAACDVAGVLEADLPPFWHIARVVRDGVQVGWGLARCKDLARRMALIDAGLLRLEVVADAD